MGRLLALFIVVPFVELYLLLSIGKQIGAAPTIALVLVTGVAGAALTRVEGFKVLRHARAALNQGRMPTDAVVHGLLIFIGGVLLITPGVLTDLVGFSLVLPFTRPLYATWLEAWAKRHIQTGDLRVRHWSGGGARSQPTVIDAEGEEVSVVDG